MRQSKSSNELGTAVVALPKRTTSLVEYSGDEEYHVESQKTLEQDTEPCSSFFRCLLKMKDLEYMDAYWLPGIHDEIRNWKGFRHRHIITPPVKMDRCKDDDLEFIIILYFIGIKNLRSWSISPERAYWVNAAREKNIYVGSIEDHSGILSQNIDTEDVGGATDSAARKLLRAPTRVELHEFMSKAPQALPPPKYKLFIVIWLCVYGVNLVNVLAGGSRDLLRYGLAFSAATFIGLIHQMVFIIYALVPFIMSLYAVERWIKSPRCAIEEMSPVYSILDQGLQIFAAAPVEKPSREIIDRLDRLEGKVDRLKRVNHELLQLIHERIDNDDLEAGNSPTSVSHNGKKNKGISERNLGDNRESSPGAWNSSFSIRADLEEDSAPIVDPALVKLQQYSSNNNNNNNNSVYVGSKRQSKERKDSIEESFPVKHDKNRLIKDELVRAKKERQQSVREENAKSMKKRKELMTFHSEDAPEKGLEEGQVGEIFHFDNPSLDHAEVEAAATHASSSIPSRGRSHSIDVRKSASRSGSMSILSALESGNEERTFSAEDGQEQKALTMVVTHLVKWERTLEFENWIKDMFDQMSKFHGFLGQNTTLPLHDGDPYVNAFTFESYQDLYSFLSSPERRQLMKVLLPLLEATSVAQISDERIIHDAFSELFITTGGSAPGRPPALWKISILTILSLQFIVWSISGTLIPIFQARNINMGLTLLATTFTTVVVNIYIGLPLMTLFFGSWLRVPRPALGDMRSWVAILDSGLNPWQRIAIMTLYFGAILGYGFWKYFSL